MRSSTWVFALSLAAGTTLAAQQPSPTPPPGAPRLVEGRASGDMERNQLRERQMVEDRRGSGDPLERYLFAPDVIMRRQREIGLQPAQRQQITQAIGRLEASLVELQWSMQEQQQALAEMLQQPQVSTEAALQALDRVLATEVMVKRVHFQALLQIRNVLTPEQQDRLRTTTGFQLREDER